MITNRDRVVSIFADALTTVDSFRFRSRLVMGLLPFLVSAGEVKFGYTLLGF